MYYRISTPHEDISLTGTFSGEPARSFPPWGNLLYEPDVDLGSARDNPETAPLGSMDGHYNCNYALFLDLSGAATTYQAHPFAYFPIPSLTSDSFNSNSFIAGLFVPLGYNTNDEAVFDAAYVSSIGWERPVPIFYIPQYLNDWTICGMSSTAMRNAGETRKQQPVSRRVPEEDPPFIAACKRGDLEQVRSMMTGGRQVNVVNRYGYPPLIVAASNGRLDIVRFLVERGADVNEQDKKRRTTPLIAAAAAGNSEIIKFLLKRGAKINGKGDYAVSPFAAAVLGGHNEAAKVLAEAGADPDAPVLGETPLMIAVSNGSVELVKTILAASPDTNRRSENNETALDIAKKLNLPRVISLIVRFRKSK